MEQTLSGLEELLTPEAIAEERARVLTPGKRIENVDELFGLFADLDDPGAVDALEALREEQRPARCRCVAAAEG